MDLKALPLRDGHRVLVAVSGGGDSLGLLALLLSARPRPDLLVGVAHVHHNLRGEEADRDEAAVRALAKALGLPFVRARLRGKPGPGESTEAWAREGRYAALETLRAKGDWDWVVTAHSLDDQAETVLMRIARGTGLQGLAGIHPVSGNLVRPVLGFSGADLRRAATDCGLRWVDDSSNLDRRFLRNRVRLDVLPVLEEALPGISRRLSALARLAHEAEPPIRQHIARVEGSTVYYGCDALKILARGQAMEAFRQGLRDARGDLRGITEKHLRALLALVEARAGGSVALPGHWEGIRQKGGILLRPRLVRRKERKR